MKQFILSQSEEEKIENAKKLLAKLNHEYTVYSFGRQNASGKFIPHYLLNNVKTNDIDLKRLHDNNHNGIYFILNKFNGDQTRQPSAQQTEDFKFAFFESDSVEAENFNIEEESKKYLNLELPYVGVIFSGSKSFHIICRLDASNLEEFKERFDVVNNYFAKNGIIIDDSNSSPIKFCRFPYADRQGKDQYVLSVNDLDVSYDEWFNAIGKNFVPQKKKINKKLSYDVNDEWFNKYKSEIIKHQTKIYSKTADKATYKCWLGQLSSLLKAGYTQEEIREAGLFDGDERDLDYTVNYILSNYVNNDYDKMRARNSLISFAKRKGMVITLSNNMPQVVVYYNVKEKDGTDKKDSDGNPIMAKHFDVDNFQKFIEWCGFYILEDNDKKDVRYVKIEDNAFAQLYGLNAVKEQVQAKLKEVLQPNEYEFVLRYVDKNVYYRAIAHKEIETERDELDKIRFYFKNCVMEVDRYSIREIPYFDVNGYIWKDTIKSINFEYDSTAIRDKNIAKNSKFIQFCKDITSDKNDDETLVENPKKFISLCSALGYLISTHRKRSDAKAVYITDEKSSFMEEDISTGRTGKGILCQALKEVRFVGEKDCKVSNTDRFGLSMYQDGMTNIIFNDIPQNFNFKSLYNVVTDSIQIEKKGENLRSIDFEEGFKTIITANHICSDLADESSKGRLFIVTLTNIFNAEHTPLQRYNQQFFASNWANEERKNFYDFLMYCAQIYLKKGLIKYDDESVEEKINIASIKSDSLKEWFIKWGKINKDKLDGNYRFLLSDVLKMYKSEDLQYPVADKNFKDCFSKFFNCKCITIKGKRFRTINLDNLPNIKNLINQDETEYYEEETEPYDISCPI